MIYLLALLSILFIPFMIASIKALSIVSKRVDKKNLLLKNDEIDENGINGITDLSIFDINMRDDYSFNKLFIDDYFKTINKYTSKSKESILVMDYLAHNKHNKIKINKGKEILPVGEEYEKYYLSLEKLVRNNNINYTRILQLPFPSKKQDFSNDQAKLMTNALDLIFPQTFQHIKRLSDYPNFSLFILNPPIRLYSIMLIDNQYILSEYDRYDKQGEARPDILFVDMIGKNKQNGKIKILIDTYIEQINKVISKKEAINIEDFVKRVDDEYDKLTQKSKKKLSHKDRLRKDRFKEMILPKI